MRILKVEPGKAPYAKEMEEGLKAIQREVEGLFHPLSMGDGVILCCIQRQRDDSCTVPPLVLHDNSNIDP